MLSKALKFATEKHAGQTRKVSGLPYIVHPVEVAFLLPTFKDSAYLEELQAVCILHDTLEDTDTTFEELSFAFSPLVASVVLELTSDADRIKAVGKSAYLKQKLLGVSSYALLVKLVDRLSNVSDAPSPSYCADTEELLTFLEERRMLSKSQQRVVVAIREALAKRTLESV